ncbi:hypothetical protein K456DRAFT_1769172 [Colletotrichum gloeosporioides 23]|nr:hypothetical protein K456DRAFT_1769172 [Colletotrichum gloeosporioides 23]
MITFRSAPGSMANNYPVVDLTIDSIEHIDLTTLDESPPSSPRALNTTSEPPRKRQRLGGDASFQSPSRNLAACLKAQVKPYIDACLAEIPQGQVNTTELGRAVLCRIGSIDKFSAEFTHKKGFLSSALEQHLAKTARYLITKYAAEPEFQLNANTTSSPALSNGGASTPTPVPAPGPSHTLSRPAPTSVTATSATEISPNAATTSTHPAATPKSKHRHSTRAPKDTVSPANYRTKARAKSFKSWKTHNPRPGPVIARHKALSAWVHMERRPYTTTEERERILKGASKLIRSAEAVVSKEPVPFHVDFTAEEMEVVRRKIRELCDKKAKNKRSPDTAKELGKLLRKNPHLLTVIPPDLELKGDLAKRDRVAIRNLLDELVDRYKRPARQAKILMLQVDEFDKQNESRRFSQISSLLLAREIDGNRGFGRMRRLVNFTNEFRKAHEDDMEMRAEWVNCAGDIMTIVWTSDHNFICGTTTHSDSHNQQYNRGGNLLLCSSQSKQLKAFADHRIPRPVVQSGENSTEAMRESQSPWLYSSVVSSDYDKVNDRAYTSSFDRTVKAWKVTKDGKDMSAIGTWHHTGNVNFVVASKHESGMVATAADVASYAVRVYQINDEDVSASPFHAYNNLRAWNEGNEQTTETQKWAYFPATMQWGLAKGVQHLLVVGYSPRSFTGDDNDIPEDKRKTGEICLWNCLTGEQIKVTNSSQNVFEVAWHPTLPVFIVATSPHATNLDVKTKGTQVRVFQPGRDQDGRVMFQDYQKLDCPAEDINEITIKPNSRSHSYVTAACTDGKVYVWDTARGDKPIHSLKHKEALDKENEDIGVKFTAWGTTADRFYTGGADGRVKVWNVRDLRQPLVRDLLEAPGCVTSGAFSPDFSKLVIGDATGRVMLLSLDEEDEPPANFVQRGSRRVRRPLAFKAHDEPPPPGSNAASDSGSARGNHWLSTGQLTRHRDPTIGVIQGPSYSELGLYRKDFHFEEDPSQPLLAKNEKEQQENKKMFRPSSRTSRILPPTASSSSTLQVRHYNNIAKDLDLNMLDEMTKLDLVMDNVNLDDPVEDLGFDFDWEEE